MQEPMSTTRRIRRMAECITPKAQDSNLIETQLLLSSLYITLLQKRLAEAGVNLKNMDDSILNHLNKTIKEHLS